MHRHMQRLYIRAPSHTYPSTAPAALARAASGGGSGAAPQRRQGHTSQITQGHPCAAAGGSGEVGGGDTAIRRPRSLREVIGELHGEDPRWAVPSRILCGVAAAGQCPGAPTMQTTGDARARRVGSMSGPDIGARRATAREASCMHLCAAWQLSDFSAGWWGTRCCKVPEAMATTTIVLYIVRRLRKRYGAGQATSRAWAFDINRHQSPQDTENQICIFYLRFFARIACDEHR